MTGGYLSLAELLAKCQVTRSGCFEWAGAISKQGYPTSTILIHRLVSELVYGPPGDHQMALHACDNRRCIRPEHLRWGSHTENMQEMWARGRGWSPFLAAGVQRAALTHCPAGHPYDELNTYRHGPDARYRRCRKCNTATAARRRASV